MLVIDVCKTANNGGKDRRPRTKRNVRMLYFYDEDGHFHTKRVSWFQGLYYKTKKVKLRKCEQCKSRYVGKCDCQE